MCAKCLSVSSKVLQRFPEGGAYYTKLVYFSKAQPEIHTAKTIAETAILGQDRQLTGCHAGWNPSFMHSWHAQT